MACLHFHGGVSKPYYDSFMAQNSYSPAGTLADPEAAVGRKTNMSVSDLSYFLGLESACCFIQMFKKAEGTAPRQYRMEWKNPF